MAVLIDEFPVDRYVLKFLAHLDSRRVDARSDVLGHPLPARLEEQPPRVRIAKTGIRSHRAVVRREGNNTRTSAEKFGCTI